MTQVARATYSLGQLFQQVRNGKNVQQNKSGRGFAVTRIETISSGVISSDRVGYSSGNVAPDDPNWLEPGDILFSHINSVERIGQVSLYEGEPERLFHGINLLRLRPDQRRIIPRFALYLLQSPTFHVSLQAFINRAVNQASVSATNLKSIKLSIPPLQEQRRIAAELDAVDALRSTRMLALAKLESLTEAIFIDTFGDPSSASELVPLSDHAVVITKGTTPTSVGMEFTTAGVPFVRVQDLTYGTVEIETIDLFVSPQTSRALERSVLRPNDVLISIAGTIGRVAIVPPDAPEMNCNQAVALVRTAPSLDPVYLRAWLNTRHAQHQMFGSQVTATISNLSLTRIRELQLPIPAKADQDRFASVISEVQSLAKRVSGSKRTIDQLFASRQQHAFRGDGL
jgi:type I restriction enzyme S subunit